MATASPGLNGTAERELQIGVRRGSIQSGVGTVGMWTSWRIHGHVELKASAYALAHRGCDTTAKQRRPSTQRRAGEK